MSAPIGIIGGTALAQLAGVHTPTDPTTPNTDYGPASGPLVLGEFADRKVCFMMRHGPGHRLAPHMINYRANIRALADAGCRHVIAVAAVGGITEAMTPGRIVVPHQIVDYSWGRAHTFYDDPSRGELDHIDFTDPYAPTLRQALIRRRRRAGLRSGRAGRARRDPGSAAGDRRRD